MAPNRENGDLDGALFKTAELPYCGTFASDFLVSHLFLGLDAVTKFLRAVLRKFSFWYFLIRPTPLWRGWIHIMKMHLRFIFFFAGEVPRVSGCLGATQDS